MNLPHKQASKQAINPQQQLQQAAAVQDCNTKGTAMDPYYLTFAIIASPLVVLVWSQGIGTADKADDQDKSKLRSLRFGARTI